MTDGTRTLVVIPTYNERENLREVIERVHAAVPAAHVLVVDDNSPDGTGALADELSDRDARVRVLHRPVKQGLGAAYLAAFEWALREGYGYIVEMDADGSHRPEHLPELLRLLGTHDLVIGSRWAPGGATTGWPKWRERLSRGGSAYARVLLALPVRDVTAGYRAFRAAALRGIHLEKVHSHGYCFQIDVLARVQDAGFRIAETPIRFEERRRGVSKMSTAIIAEAMLRVTLWGLRAAPRRVARQLVRKRVATAAHAARSRF
jgi:dolichol-phosphate mannosyltransferase